MKSSLYLFGLAVVLNCLACKPINLEPLQETICLTESESYMQNGDTIARIEHYYNDQNLVIEKVYFDSTDTVVGREVTDYDASGNIITYARFEGDTREYYCEKEWNADNLLILMVAYDEAGQLSNRHSYSYSPEGLLIQVSQYSPPSSLQTVVYEYNDEGQQSTIYFYNDGVDPGNLLSKRRSFYDDQGRLIRWQSFGPNDEPGYYTVFEYNDAGNVIFRAEYKWDDTLSYSVSTTYLYDDADRILDLREVNQDGLFIRREINEYDEYGNLSKQTKFTGGQEELQYLICFKYDCFEQDLH